MSFILCIVGGSGSGKTSLAKELLSHYQNATLLPLDNYYKDRPDLSLEEKAHLNYDSPTTLDGDLFEKHLNALKNGEAIEMPLWDFASHSRKAERKHVEPSPLIIVDGILALRVVEGEVYDYRIFVDADSDTRLARRLLRDTKERGRTPESVIEQYVTTVKPMHLRYVEPCRYEADFIFHNDKNGKLDREELAVLEAKLDHFFAE